MNWARYSDHVHVREYEHAQCFVFLIPGCGMGSFCTWCGTGLTMQRSGYALFKHVKCNTQINKVIQLQYGTI